jgi:hypothetical protein
LLLRLLTVFSAAEVVAHGLHLLHLVGRKDLRELLVGVLEDGLGLNAALVLSEAGVAAKLGHLLLLGSEDGLKPGGLVGGEIETLAEVLGGLLGVHLAVVAAVMSVLTSGLLCGGVTGGLSRLLSEGRGGGQSNCQGGVEKNAIHVSAAPCGNAALPDVLMK